MSTKHNITDPTFLRTIHDGLLSGAIHKDNATNLPIGLIGIYEEAIPPTNNVNERRKFLEFFAVWALLKKEVSAAFVVPLLEGWTEELVLDYITKYSKWFNSPVSGKYVLYHERFRTFVIQKISQSHFTACNEAIIQNCQIALQAKSGDEWEYYALEHLSLHLLIQAMESKDATALKTLAYDTAHWNRQVEISKGFEWSKRMLNNIMLWASKYDDEEVIECALNKVDLHHQEQNDAPRIVELVAQNDIETALQRIEAFGGNDKEGIQRKFILYMLCLMELTLLDSKDKPFRKDAIDKLLKHLDENLPVDHSVLNWDDFFPSYLMFQMACEWAEMELEYLNIYTRTNDWEKEWISEGGPYSDLQFEVLTQCSIGIKVDIQKSYAKMNIAKVWAKQGRIQEALECSKNISDDLDNSITLKDISTELVKIGKVDEALEIAHQINNTLQKSIALKEISTELAIQGKMEEAISLMQQALECAQFIKDERSKNITLKDIIRELTKQGKIEEALSCTQDISEDDWKCKALLGISSELAKQRKIEEAASTMQEAIACAKAISDEILKNRAMKDISEELANQGMFEKANEFIQHILDDGQKNQALQTICIELAKQGDISKAIACSRDINDELDKIETFREISKARDNIDILTMAIHNINEIKDDSSIFLKKGIELKQIAIECFKRGLFDMYNRLIDDALKLLSLLNYDDADKGAILEKIALELTEIGALKDAYRFIEKLRYFPEKESVLKNISNQEAVIGNFRNCSIVLLKLLSINKELGEKEIDTVSIEISINLSRKNFTDNALIIANSISNDWDNAYALWQIALECIKQDKFEIGFEIALSIKDINHIEQACEEIALELIKKGEISMAVNILQRLTDMNGYCGSSYLSYLSTQLFSQNKIEDASLLIEKAINCIPCVCEDYEKSQKYISIYAELIKQDKKKQAESMMEEALDFIQNIPDDDEKNSSIQHFATEMVKQGKIVSGIEYARGITDDFFKYATLKAISSELREEGSIEKASIVLEEALESAWIIKKEKSKFLALKDISIELAKQGKTEKALECAQSIQNDRSRNRALSGIANELAKLRKVSEALECANCINDDKNKSSAQMDICIELSKLGLIKDAYECSLNILDDSDKSKALNSIASELAKQENWPLCESIGLEIPQILDRQNGWREIAKNTSEEKGWMNALQVVNQFQNAEVKMHYLKSLADSLNSIESDKEMLLNARSYYFDDIESMEKLLQHHALNELFFSDASNEKIERFNRTLNLQWAIDIKNSFRVN